MEIFKLPGPWGQQRWQQWGVDFCYIMLHVIRYLIFVFLPLLNGGKKKVLQLISKELCLTVWVVTLCNIICCYKNLSFKF